MRLFVVLALVAFTGCQANVLRSDEPQTQLGMVKDAFWDYLVKASKTALDSFTTLRESELGQQVNTRIEDSVQIARQYAAIVQDQVSIIGQEAYDKVSEQVDRLSERLQQDLRAVKAQLEPYTEQLKANIEQQVERLGQEWQEVAPYTEFVDTLKDTLWQKSMELIRILERSLIRLDTLLGPSTQELRDELAQQNRKFWRIVAPPVGSAINQIERRRYKLVRTLTPYVDDWNEKLDPYTKDLDSWLTSLWESFTKSAQD
ncbi:apolipoprotein A-I-like [Conger conger]|uniref:apolipoprotein A-I-like n=1 Tax=Conger conger TaxID=82655 RepID=UPI002A5A80B5|nr:apolipoprotein A-I-like [Conger conger]